MMMIMEANPFLSADDDMTFDKPEMMVMTNIDELLK